MARLAPTQNVIRKLFALSGNRCAFPGCSAELIDSESLFIGQICHIEAANDGGQRSNLEKDDEERRSFDNLILLCYPHHKKTDNVSQYPVEVLRAMKQSHERQFQSNPYNLSHEAETLLMKDISLKLDHIHNDVLESKQATRDGLDEIREMHRETQNILAQLQANKSIAAAEPPKIFVDQSGIYSSQLDFIRRLRSSNKTTTALEELNRLRHERWEEMDNELRYKVIANIAGSLLDLGKTEEAGRLLMELEQIDYQTCDSLAYLGLGYAINRNKAKFEEIIRHPLMAKSENSNLWVAFVNLYKGDLSPIEVEERIPSAAFDAPEVSFALGELYTDYGDHTLGFALFDKALAGLGNEIDKRWHLQGVIATQKLIKIASIEKIAFRAFNAEDREQIGELIIMLSESWAYISQTERAAASWYLVLNRGVAYRALGEHRKAEQDFKTAWKLTSNFASYRNLVLQFIDTEQYEKAEELLMTSSIDSDSGFSKLDHTLLEARLKFLNGKPEQAAQALQAALANSYGSDRRLVLDLIVVGLFEAGIMQMALPYIEMLIEEFPESPQGYLAKGTYLRKLDEIKEAEVFLQKTLLLMQARPDPVWVWYLLSEEYYQLKRFSDAINCLRKVYKPGLNNDITRRLMLALFYNGNYEETQTLCEQIIEVSNDDALAHEVLFRVFEVLGKTEQASETIEQFLLRGKSGKLNHFNILGIKFYHSKNELGKLRRILSTIEDGSGYPLHLRFMIAQMHLIYGKPTIGLEIAFQARIEHFDTAKVHELYVNLLLGSAKQEIERAIPEQVTEMTGVETVDDTNLSTLYFITADERFKGSNVLRPRDPLAVSFIGKKVGEEAVLQSTIGAGRILTINTILSKFSFCLRESLKLLETRYTGQSEIQFFQNQGDHLNKDIRNFLQLDSIARLIQEREVYSLYDSGHATIGFVAQYLKCDAIDIWLRLILESSNGIHCYDKDEVEDLAWTISNNRPVVVDITALLTLHVLLESEELLESFGFDLHIAQATLDEIIQHRYKLEVFHPAECQPEDDSLISAEISDPQRQKQWCDKIINWCNKNTTQQIPKATISMDGRIGEFEETIGHSSYHTLELANQLGASLLCDEARLKSLALNDNGIKSFSTYQLLIKLLAETVVSISEFNHLSETLIRNNFLYIPVTGEQMWSLFEETTFKIKAPFTQSVKVLKVLNQDQAATALVAFGRNLYLNSFPPANRDAVLLLMLSTLSKRPDYSTIKIRILRNVDRLFRLLPQHRDNFRQLILSM